MENNSPISSIHVAIIMDGNGRWAEARGLPRTEGHKVGVKVVREIVEASVERGPGRHPEGRRRSVGILAPGGQGQ